jgi:hypothetical protein
MSDDSKRSRTPAPVNRRPPPRAVDDDPDAEADAPDYSGTPSPNWVAEMMSTAAPPARAVAAKLTSAADRVNNVALGLVEDSTRMFVLIGKFFAFIAIFDLVTHRVLGWWPHPPKIETVYVQQCAAAPITRRDLLTPRAEADQPIDGAVAE